MSKFLQEETINDASRTQIHQNMSLMSLSRDARLRLKWILHFQKYRNARLTCRHFGLSPDTFYLWKRRFNPNNLLSLEGDKNSRRPKNLRKPLLKKGLTKIHEVNTL